MALKVEIYQKDIVRPFSPTPESLRNYKLSLFDQMGGTHYTPTVLFYSSGSQRRHDYDQLKESLSKTLSVLYPLAGRVKDGFTIECNDKGADFVGANVTNYDLADFLRFPKVDRLQQLLPRDPFAMDFDHSQPMLAVQVNKFRCGGTGVAICLWHGVADGAALAGFVQTWAAINRGEGGGGLSIPDATKIFPPINSDFSKATSTFVAGRKLKQGKYSTKRFVFCKQEIERMRDEHNVVSDHHRRPSRVGTLSAFIWAAVIRATLKAKQNLKIHMLAQTVDLRKRMNPPFPSMCLGNIMQLCIARWEANAAAAVNAQSLIGSIREAVVKVTDDYVRKMHADGGYMKVLTAELGKIFSDPNTIEAFGISSVCGFPFIESDFGWGKPIWFVPAVSVLQDGAYFFDTTDGGIEVWIGLPHQLMSNLDKDNEFLAHVSCNQIIWEPSRLPNRL